MKIADTVMISLEFEGSMVDIETPCFLVIKELLPKIENILCCVFPEKFKKASYLELIYNCQKLEIDKHLAFYGIWDGSIIKCRQVLFDE